MKMKFGKKITVYILCFLLCFTALFPIGVLAEDEEVTYSTDYPNTWQNTGDLVEDLIGIAMTQVGYYGNTTVGTKYGAWYGKNFTYSQWCGMFIAWCADQAGISTDIILKTAKANNFRNSGVYHYKEDYTPQRGDLVLYNPMTGGYSGSYYWPEKNADGTYKESSHVAIVCSYDSAAKKIWVVHGNSTGDKVCYNSISVSSDAIQAFVTPAYKGTSSTPSAPVYDYVNGDSVRMREGPGTNYTIITSYNTGTSVEILDTVTNDAGEKWYRVKVISSGKTGYIRSDFITVINKTDTPTDHYINGDNVRLRSDAGTEFDILGQYDKGTTVEILGEKTNSAGEKWYNVKIISNDEVGYIRSDFITLVEETDEPEYDYTNSSYNLRSAPGTWNEVVGSVSKNARVYILEASYDTDGDKWYYVRVADSGVEGYIYYKRVTVNSKDDDAVAVESSVIYSAPGAGSSVYTAKSGDALTVKNITYDGKGNKWLRVALQNGSAVVEGYIAAKDVVLYGKNRKNVVFTSKLESPVSGTSFDITDSITVRGWAFANAGEAPCFYSIDGGAKTPFEVEKRTDVKKENSACTTDYAGFKMTFSAEELSYGEHTVEIFASCDVTVQSIYTVSFSVLDSEMPECALWDVTDIDSTGYTVVVTATDNMGISSVYTKTTVNGVAVQHIGSLIAEDLYSVRVKTADFGGANAEYTTTVYVRDTYNNVVTVKEFTINPITYTTVQISFDANGGSNAPGMLTADYEGYVTIPNEIPTGTDFVFKGWSTEKNGTVQYTAGIKYKFTSSVTLYAVWAAVTVGDVSGDGVVNTTDLAVMKLALSGDATVELTVGDFNCDGSFDTTDLAQLKLYLAG